MAGLQRVLKIYGSMKVGGQTWLYDYAKDEPVKAEDMPFGSERHRASELARAELMRESPPSQGREKGE